MATRSSFSAVYKHEAVELARSSNKTASQIARDLGMDPNMLSRWCRELETSPKKAFPGQGKTRDEELAALKRELAQVKKERDFLKEAAVFFAKDSK
ncbi:transposase [Candidatus Woesebacteria bacterium]|nr:transposase [Candidatus Woesebacteria bacterium]